MDTSGPRTVLFVLTKSVIVQVLNYARFSRIFPRSRSTGPPSHCCPLLASLARFCSACQPLSGWPWNHKAALALLRLAVTVHSRATVAHPFPPLFANQSETRLFVPPSVHENGGLCFLSKMDGDREETTRCKSKDLKRVNLGSRRALDAGTKWQSDSGIWEVGGNRAQRWKETSTGKHSQASRSNRSLTTREKVKRHPRSSNISGNAHLSQSRFHTDRYGTVPKSPLVRQHVLAQSLLACRRSPPLHPQDWEASETDQGSTIITARHHHRNRYATDHTPERKPCEVADARQACGTYTAVPKTTLMRRTTLVGSPLRRRQAGPRDRRATGAKIGTRKEWWWKTTKSSAKKRELQQRQGLVSYHETEPIGCRVHPLLLLPELRADGLQASCCCCCWSLPLVPVIVLVSR